MRIPHRIGLGERRLDRVRRGENDPATRWQASGGARAVSPRAVRS
jgi:hypothetical protein